LHGGVSWGVAHASFLTKIERKKERRTKKKGQEKERKEIRNKVKTEKETEGRKGKEEIKMKLEGLKLHKEKKK
jgi:hypothetical protein